MKTIADILKEYSLKTLKGADLRGVNIRGADLGASNMRYTNLKEVDLRGVHLEGAILRKANLRRANLDGVNLKKVDLRWAILDEVVNANFDGAILDTKLIKYMRKLIESRKPKSSYKNPLEGNILSKKR